MDGAKGAPDNPTPPPDDEVAKQGAVLDRPPPAPSDLPRRSSPGSSAPAPRTPGTPTSRGSGGAAANPLTATARSSSSGGWPAGLPSPQRPSSSPSPSPSSPRLATATAPPSAVGTPTLLLGHPHHPPCETNEAPTKSRLRWLAGGFAAAIALQCAYIGGSVATAVLTDHMLWRSAALLMFAASFTLLHIGATGVKIARALSASLPPGQPRQLGHDDHHPAEQLPEDGDESARLNPAGRGDERVSTVQAYFSSRGSEWEVVCVAAVIQGCAAAFDATSFFTTHEVGGGITSATLASAGGAASVLLLGMGIAFRHIIRPGPASVRAHRMPHLMACIFLAAGQLGFTLFHWAPFSTPHQASPAAAAASPTPLLSVGTASPLGVGSGEVSAEAAGSFSEENVGHIVRASASILLLGVMSVTAHSEVVLINIAGVLMEAAACVVDVFFDKGSPYHSEAWYIRYSIPAFEGVFCIALVFLVFYLNNIRRLSAVPESPHSVATTAITPATTATPPPDPQPQGGDFIAPGEAKGGDLEAGVATVSSSGDVGPPDDLPAAVAVEAEGEGGGGGGGDAQHPPGSPAEESAAEERGVVAVPSSSSSPSLPKPPRSDAAVSAAAAAALLCSVAQYPSRCPFASADAEGSIDGVYSITSAALLSLFVWEVAEQHPESSCSCPAVCGVCIREVPRNLLASHTGSEACRNALGEQGCPLCGEPFSAEEDASGKPHFEICPEVPIPCPLGCGVEVTRRGLPEHTASACANRAFDERCPLLCGNSSETPAEGATHLMACPSRETPCPLGCGANVLRKALAAHLLGSCGSRRISCASGCGANLRASELFSHMEVCPQRRERCPKGPPCDARMPVASLPSHISRGCPAGGDCPRCGAYLSHAALPEHFGGGNCPGYPIGKPPHTQEGVGQEGGLVFQDCPLGCPELIDPEGGLALALGVHFESCGEARVVCPRGCGSALRRSAVAEHCSRECFKRAVSCLLCGKVMAAEKLAGHIPSCPMKRAPCPNKGCSALLLQGGEFADHNLNTCASRMSFCTLCSTFLPHTDLLQHYLRCAGGVFSGTPEGSPVPLLVCPKRCGTALPSQESLARHALGCSVEMACPLGCGDSVAADPEGFSAHISKACRKRFTVCSNGCGEVIQAEEQGIHNAQCHARIVPCPLGCTARIQASRLSTHLERCALRLMQCPKQCGSVISHAELLQHMSRCPGGVHTVPQPPPPPPQAPRRSDGSVASALKGQRGTGGAAAAAAVSNTSTPRHVEFSTEMGAAGGLPVAECIYGCGEGGAAGVPLGSLHYQRCPNRPVRCEGCGEMVPGSEMPHHSWEDCPARSVGCPYGCGVSTAHSDLAAHFSACPHSPTPCTLGCGAIFASPGDASHHSSTSCPLRVFLCPVCSTPVPLGEASAHLETCSAAPGSTAPTTCPLACGEGSAASLLDGSHIASECRNRFTQCEACGDILNASAMKRHVAYHCLHRKVTCGDCGGEMTSLGLPEHLMYDCVESPHKVCPLGCALLEVGKGGARSRFGTDADVCKHLLSCPARPTRCGICGAWRFVSRGTGGELTHHDCAPPDADLLDCPWGCGAKLEPASVNTHAALACPGLLAPCRLGCGASIPRGHHALHCLRHCPLRKTRCSQCGAQIPSSELADHKLGDCPKQHIPCRLGCGRLLHPNSLEKHVTKHCAQRIIACPLSCGADAVPLSSLTLHLAICPAASAAGGGGGENADNTPRVAKSFACPLHCGADVAASGWEAHASDACPRMPVPCTAGCGVHVERGRLAHHLEHRCPTRKVLCPSGCLEMVPAAHRLHHDRTCGRAAVPCPHPGCDHTAPPGETRAHMKSCPRRPAPCPVEGCGAVIPLCELEAHAQTCAAGGVEWCAQRCGVKGCSSENPPSAYHRVCPLAVRQCANGCPESVAVRGMAVHCDTACSQGPSFCPDCGDPIPTPAGLATHAARACAARTLPCVKGCGETLLWSALPSHAALRCPKRRVPCRFGCPGLHAVGEVRAHEEVCELRPAECRHCGGLFAAGGGHEASCGMRPVFCDHCKAPMKGRDLPSHTAECGSRPAACEFCKVVLPLHALADHRDRLCEERRACPDCGAEVAPGGLAVHRRRDCAMREVPCVLCHQPIRAGGEKEHEASCVLASTKCPICATEVLRRDLALHQQICRQAAVNTQKVSDPSTVRPFLGLDVADYTVYGSSIAAVVRKVVPASAASASGVEEGSVVLGVGGASVGSREDFLRVFREKPLKPFDVLAFSSVPRNAVLAVEGRKADPEEQRRTLEGRAVEVPCLVGTLPRMSPEEYYSCKHCITLSCLSHVATAFRGVGCDAPKISAEEVPLVLRRVGVEVSPESVTAVSVTSVGFSLLDVLEWVRAYGYVGKIELFIAQGN